MDVKNKTNNKVKRRRKCETKQVIKANKQGKKQTNKKERKIAWKKNIHKANTTPTPKLTVHGSTHVK